MEPTTVLPTAICICEFKATDPDELTLTVNDSVQITRLDIGDGWSEGIVDGQLGMFPQEYVKILSLGTQSTSSKNAATNAEYQNVEVPNKNGTNPFADVLDAGASLTTGERQLPRKSNPFLDEAPTTTTTTTESVEEATSTTSLSESTPQSTTTTTTPTPTTTLGTSTFASPSSSIASHMDEATFTEEESVNPKILAGAMWQQQGEVFEVYVTKGVDPGKKFAGVKKFTTYDITNRATNITVNRRFKHFDWLHEQLVRTFSCVNIPSLPEKQMTKRFGEEFIEQRRLGLQQFMNRVAIHPVLGASFVFKHFLTAVAFKDWKQGKRIAEQKPDITTYVEIADDDFSVNMDSVIERTSMFMQWLQKLLQGWNVAGEDLLVHMDGLRSAYDRMSAVLAQFADDDASRNYEVWWEGSGDANTKFDGVMGSLQQLGCGMQQIARLLTDQQEIQRANFLDALKEYQAMAKTLPLISLQYKARKAAAHGQALGNKSPPPKQKPIDNTEAERIANVTAKIVLAEFRYFHEAMVKDFHQIITEFIAQQIAYHQQATASWTQLLKDVAV